MSGIVLEGGTFRPIFSCGIMDCLNDHDIMFDYCIGVSAGITDGVSYVSKQPRRNLEILKTYRHDPRYIGLRNYKTDHSLFGLKFAYETMSNELNPFDYDTFYKSHTKVLVGVTNANTGKAEYIDGHKIDRHCTVLKATCAIPIVFPAIKIGENEYFDGGIADSIPVKKAIEASSSASFLFPAPIMRAIKLPVPIPGSRIFRSGPPSKPNRSRAR